MAPIDITGLCLRDQVHALIERSVEYQVIETATGRRVAGSPSYSFAKYVRDVRDWFNAGTHLVKRCQ